MKNDAGKISLCLFLGAALLNGSGIAVAQQSRDENFSGVQRRSFDFTAPDPSAILNNPVATETPRRHLRDFGPEATSVKPLPPDATSGKPSPLETAPSKPNSDIADEFRQPDPSKILPNPTSAEGPRPYIRNFGTSARIGAASTNYGTADVNGRFSEETGGGNGTASPNRTGGPVGVGPTARGAGKGNATATANGPGGSSAQAAANGQTPGPARSGAPGATAKGGGIGNAAGGSQAQAAANGQTPGPAGGAPGSNSNGPDGSQVQTGANGQTPGPVGSGAPGATAKGGVIGNAADGSQAQATANGQTPGPAGGAPGPKDKGSATGNPNGPGGSQAQAAANGQTPGPVGSGAPGATAKGGVIGNAADGSQAQATANGQAPGPAGGVPGPKDKGSATGNPNGPGGSRAQAAANGQTPGPVGSGAPGATAKGGGPGNAADGSQAQATANGQAPGPAGGVPGPKDKGSATGNANGPGGSRAQAAANGQTPGPVGSGAPGATAKGGGPGNAADGSQAQATANGQAPGPAGGVPGPKDKGSATGNANGPDGSQAQTGANGQTPGPVGSGAPGATAKGGGPGNPADGSQAQATANGQAPGPAGGAPGPKDKGTATGNPNGPGGSKAQAAANGQTPGSASSGAPDANGKASASPGGNSSAPGGNSSAAQSSGSTGGSSGSPGGPSAAAGGSSAGNPGNATSEPITSPGRIRLSGAYTQLLEVATFGGRRFDTPVIEPSRPLIQPPHVEPPRTPENLPASTNSGNLAPTTAARPGGPQAEASPQAVSHAKPVAVPGSSSTGGVALAKTSVSAPPSANASSRQTMPASAPQTSKGLSAVGAQFAKVDWQQFDADQAVLRADPAALGRMSTARRQNLAAGNAALEEYAANKDRLNAQLEGIKKGLDRQQELHEARIAMFDQAALEGRYASVAIAGFSSVSALLHGALAVGQSSGVPAAYPLSKALKGGENLGEIYNKISEFKFSEGKNLINATISDPSRFYAAKDETAKSPATVGPGPRSSVKTPPAGPTSDRDAVSKGIRPAGPVNSGSGLSRPEDVPRRSPSTKGSKLLAKPKRCGARRVHWPPPRRPRGWKGRPSLPALKRSSLRRSRR